MWDRRLFVALLCAFGVVLLINAWVVDDAYITLRTVDNFVHGYGLRWNIDERVQVYTHPLWMLLLTAFYFVTREAFYTSIFVSWLLSLTAVVIAARFLTDGFRVAWWRAALFLLGLLSCKAVIDYSSSGLETPLSYCIVAIFIATFLREDYPIDSTPGRRVLLLVTLTSLMFLNHPDLVLLFAPAVLWIVASRLRRATRETMRLV